MRKDKLRTIRYDVIKAMLKEDPLLCVRVTTFLKFWSRIQRVKTFARAFCKT